MYANERESDKKKLVLKVLMNIFNLLILLIKTNKPKQFLNNTFAFVGLDNA